MHTNWCILIEISMEIRMAKFWSTIIVSCVTLGEFHFSYLNIFYIPDENEPAVLDSMYNGYSPYLLEGWLLVGQHRTFLPFPSYVVRICYPFTRILKGDSDHGLLYMYMDGTAIFDLPT